MGLQSSQIKAFVAVVKCKTVHAAATELNLTQTAVTQRIRVLERQLSTTLFIRTRRGMQLTPEGEVLLHYCKATTELENEALAKIQGAAHQTDVSLCISGPSSIMQARIIPECQVLLKDFPHLLLHFDMNDFSIGHQNLKAGACDLAIIQQQDLVQEMQYKELKPEQYCLVASPAWKNRKLKDIIQNERIIDFDPSDSATFDYLKQYDLFDLAMHGRHFANRTESLANLVMQGVGYTTLAKEFAEPYIKDGLLITLNAGKTLDYKTVLAWYSRNEPPDYFAALINAIK